MSNYVFLDLDGVLNNRKYLESLFGEWGLDPKCVKLFAKLCKEFDCKVVLSSGWRRNLNDDLTPIDFILEQRKWNKEHNLDILTDTDLILNTFKENDINLVGKTDTLVKLVDHNKWDRVGQIYRYVKKYLTKEDKFIILDDYDVIYDGLKKYRFLESNFIQTDYFGNGFDEEAYEKAKNIFTN